MNWAKWLQSGVGDIDFDCIFTAGQVGVGSNLTKRLQSGEGDIDFDCIFTAGQVVVGQTAAEW